MPTFLLIWFGEMLSLTGSGLTRFALGVWVYTQTGSATQFSLIALSALLPAVLLTPVAGALVDRWPLRRALLLSNAGAGSCSMLIALLLLLGQLNVPAIYLLTALGAAFSAFQWPAFMSTTSLLVPPRQLGRAAGLMQFAMATGQIVSPLLAGLLTGVIGLHGIVLLDVASFLIALLIVAVVRLPAKAPHEATQQATGGLLAEIAYGWRYITSRPGLLALLLFFAATNFLLGIVTVLVTPLVLSFADQATLGWILSTAATGMLAGSLLVSIWGGPKRRIHGVLGGTLLQGSILLLGGLPPTALLVCGVAWLFLFANPIIVSASQAIWQSKIEQAVQGRVFATRRMIAWSSVPLAYLVAGPLVDYVFQPLMAPDGWLAGSLGLLIGVGAGRGVGLLFMVMGVLTILATLAGYFYAPLRFVEDDLPDAVVAGQAAPGLG